MPKKQPKIEGGYIVVPKNTIKCKQYQALSNVTKLVYQAFLVEFIRDSRVNPQNKVKITHNQLELYSGVSHGSVVRSTKALKAAGFIKTLIPGGLEGNPSEYQLNSRYTNSGTIEAYW